MKFNETERKMAYMPEDDVRHTFLAARECLVFSFLCCLLRSAIEQSANVGRGSSHDGSVVA